MPYGNAPRKEFDNTDSGVLFKNDRKETEKHPDYTGTINVGGIDFRLAGWKKETKRGPALSLKISLKQEKPTYDRAGDYQRPTSRGDEPF
jgi:hypothetical protein